MGKQVITSAIENGKRMGQYLQKGDIEGAKMLAAQLLGANGPLLLEALMSKSTRSPEEIGHLFEKIARIIEQKRISMIRKIRKRMKEAKAEEQAAAIAQQIAAEKMAEQIKEREVQLNKAIEEKNDLERKLKEKERLHAEEKKRLAEQRKQLELQRKKASKEKKKEIDAEIKKVEQKEKALNKEMKSLKENFERKKKEIKERREYLQKLKQRQAKQQGDMQGTPSPQQTVAPRETSPMIQTMDGMSR